MARRRNSKAHMAYVRSFRKGARKTTRRRRSYRRNPWPVGGLVVNPRRRRRSYRRVARRASRRSYRRNPAIMGFSIPPIKQVLFAGVGFAGTPVVEGFVNQFVPVSITGNTFGKYAVKVGSMILLSFAVKKIVGQQEGTMVAIGGGAYILTSAVAEFAPGVIPGLSAYVPGNQLSAYVSSNQPGYTGLGMLPVSSGTSFGRGNTAIGGTAERFRRF